MYKIKQVQKQVFATFLSILANCEILQEAYSSSSFKYSVVHIWVVTAEIQLSLLITCDFEEPCNLTKITNTICFNVRATLKGELAMTDRYVRR